MTEVVKDDTAIVYLDRREFLIASAADARPRFQASISGSTYYAIADTEAKARKAMWDASSAGFRRMNRDEMTRLMAAELTAKDDETE